MKRKLIILTLFISTNSFGQQDRYYYDTLSRTEKFYNDSGHVDLEIKQLDKEYNKQRHIITYNQNGTKKEEYYERDKINYDTLKQWTEKGELHHMEIYSDSGYINIDYYYETGRILEIGNYKMMNTPPNNVVVVYDSATFVKYTTAKCKNPCYIRTGIWKQYRENGTLECEGQYLPLPLVGNVIMARDSSGIFVASTRMNHSFEMENGYIYSGMSAYFKDGTWNYYNEKGVKTQEEYYKDGHLKRNSSR